MSRVEARPAPMTQGASQALLYNAKGVAKTSPGLPGRSHGYPGVKRQWTPTPTGLRLFANQVRHNPFRVASEFANNPG